MFLKSCFICACCFILKSMASTDVRIFFPQINGNLSQITWAHAVNSRELLTETLANNDTMMIEADVILGTIENDTNITPRPVMGHPPNIVSDITLSQFLDTIDAFNTNDTNITRKGVKLDFKSIDVFLASQNDIVQHNLGSYPFWLNADILPGPVNSRVVPVNATKFLTNASGFNNSVLSIGWTTNYGANFSGSYTMEQINAMTTTIRAHNIAQEITFPMRAGLAAESVQQITLLLNNVSGSTLTIWSSEGDNVNIPNLRNLIREVGVNNTFVDVPAGLRAQLKLDTLSSGAKASLSVVGVFMAMLPLFM